MQRRPQVYFIKDRNIFSEFPNCVKSFEIAYSVVTQIENVVANARWYKFESAFQVLIKHKDQHFDQHFENTEFEILLTGLQSVTHQYLAVASTWPRANRKEIIYLNSLWFAPGGASPTGRSRSAIGKVPF